MIDTHAHLTDEKLIARADEIVANFEADKLDNFENIIKLNKLQKKINICFI